MNTLEFLSRLEGVKSTGDGWEARCPAHEDRKASLSINVGDDERILLKCFAGCPVDSICAGIDLRTSNLFPEKRAKQQARIVTAYDYVDEHGALIFQALRYDPKGFRQRRPDPSRKGEWIWKMKGVRRVLYRLPDVLAAVEAGRTIFIPEGEKDADALSTRGFVATTNAMGASSKWLEEYTKSLRGAARVVVVADKDKAGREHAQEVACALHGVVPSVRVLELPDREGKPVKDSSDWFAADGTAGELKDLVKNTEDFAPALISEPLEIDVDANGENRKETDEEVFQRLAALSSIDYDRYRNAEARKLKIRIATLDDEVKRRTDDKRK